MCNHASNPVTLQATNLSNPPKTLKGSWAMSPLSTYVFILHLSWVISRYTYYVPSSITQASTRRKVTYGWCRMAKRLCEWMLQKQGINNRLRSNDRWCRSVSARSISIQPYYAADCGMTFEFHPRVSFGHLSLASLHGCAFCRRFALQRIVASRVEAAGSCGLCVVCVTLEEEALLAWWVCMLSCTLPPVRVHA